MAENLTLKVKGPKLYKHTLQIISYLRIALLCIMSVVCLLACNPDRENVISPEEFQNADQEDLGDQLFDAMTGFDSPFEMLPKSDYSFVYEHVETLYKQSYFILRAKQGWTTNRDWRIAIFKDENQAAFSFPGGNLMISTGMLKTFTKEYELFYLLSFENALMDSGYLFANLLTFVEDSIDIEKLIDDADRERALQIGMDMYARLEYNALITEEIDFATMDWICQSSDFRVDGIARFYPKLQDDSNWLLTRMSSLNRLSSVNSNFIALDCQDERITSLGNDFYLNEILPLLP